MSKLEAVKILKKDLGRVMAALKRNGCCVPGLCASYPYACGCGFLVRAKFDTPECIERLAKGLPIGSERTS